MPPSRAVRWNCAHAALNPRLKQRQENVCATRRPARHLCAKVLRAKMDLASAVGVGEAVAGVGVPIVRWTPVQANDPAATSMDADHGAKAPSLAARTALGFGLG